jgi:hypothetical protein
MPCKQDDPRVINNLRTCCVMKHSLYRMCASTTIRINTLYVSVLYNLRTCFMCLCYTICMCLCYTMCVCVIQHTYVFYDGQFAVQAIGVCALSGGAASNVRRAKIWDVRSHRELLSLEVCYHSCHYICRVGLNPYICTVYDRIVGDFPAQNTVCTPLLYGSGRPYIFAHRKQMCVCSHECVDYTALYVNRIFLLGNACKWESNLQKCA